MTNSGERPWTWVKSWVCLVCGSSLVMRQRSFLGEELISTGSIPENFLIEEARHPYLDKAPSYGWFLKNKKVTILGDGNAVSSFEKRSLKSTLIDLFANHLYP